MKIVILASRFPYPLEKGDKLRLYHQLREMSRHHDIVLCAINSRAVSAKDREALMPFCSKICILRRTRWMIFKNLVWAFFTGVPLQVAYFFDKKLKRQFRQIVEAEKPGHVYCQLIRTALYAENIGVPATIDYMDNFSKWTRKLAGHSTFLPRRLLLQREADRVALFEKKIYNWFGHHTIISRQDARAFGFAGSDDITCVPNGVDTSFFQPQPQRKKQYDIAFVGNLGYYNNVEAAKYLVREIMPLVWSRNEKVKVLLAGARPSEEVMQLEEERVTVLGWMEDIRDAYAMARMVVAPIFLAVGQQNKILEAMAMGIPCITTSRVNNAIGAKDDTSILIAENAEAFARQVLRLLADGDLQKMIRENGLMHVRENYTWESAVSPLLNIIESRHDKN